MNHLLGYAALSVNVLIVVGLIVFRFVSFSRRYKTIVRTDFRADGIIPEGAAPDSEAIREAIEKASPSASGVLRYSIHVVPDTKVINVPLSGGGFTRSGKMLRGSIYIDRMFPIPPFKRRWVIISHESHWQTITIHEAIQHLLSVATGRGYNAAHSDKELDQIEKDAKRHYKEITAAL